MNTAELKIDIIGKIMKIKELRIIEEIQKFLDLEMETGEYKLNDAQKNRILEAKSDKLLTEEEANKNIEEWLKEK